MATFCPPFGVAAEPVDAQALADAVADRRPRVEAGVGVLEDDLHPPAVGLEVGALERRELGAVELDRPGGRLDEPQDEPTDGRLAAARLADQAERLAAPDVEADAVDGLDRGDRPLHDPAPDREVLDEVPDPDERAIRVAGGGRRALAGDGCRRRRHLAHGRLDRHAGAAPVVAAERRDRHAAAAAAGRGSGTPRTS